MEFQKFKTIGLMSGTSCDGLDICYCHFSWDGLRWNYEIIIGETIPYKRAWLERIREAPKLDGRGLLLFHKDLGRFFGKETKAFIERHSLADLDFIASHGHTIFHEPEIGLTFQAGDGNCIAAETGCSVLFDFRSLDVALGGQGAPLVPIGDRYLFSEYDACLNLGGISNISFEREGKVWAFDICPFNLLLNHFANKLGESYDSDGNFAKDGKVNKKILDQLNGFEYLARMAPKSLGREQIERLYFELFGQYKLEERDWLRTLIEHYVISVANVFNHFSIQKVLITGGGAYNKFFIRRLKEVVKSELHIPDNKMIEFKEALLFSFLGCLNRINCTNVLASVTGASKDSKSGVEVN
jgi:anhydro-N-acetylmuramic acid kinase